MNRHRSIFIFVALLVACIGTSVKAVPPPPFRVRAYAKSSTEVTIKWPNQGNNILSYDVYHDGIKIGTTTSLSFTDTGVAPGTAHAYSVADTDVTGTGPPCQPEMATTKRDDLGFVVDGIVDFSRYIVQSGGDCGCGSAAYLPIYAAVRGTTLYVATANIPPGGQYDYFIFIGGPNPSFSWMNAPWAKTGAINIAPNSPFIGAESTNTYVGWFNAPATAQVVRPTDGSGVIEGTIDLVEAFGSMPDAVVIAVVAYQTWDGGHVVEQSPYGNRDDFIGELRGLYISTLRDEDADGLLDMIDPTKEFKLTQKRNSDGSVTVSAPAIPRDEYFFNVADSADGPWGYGGIYTPPDDTTTVSFTDTQANSYPQRFYRILCQDLY
jgi:hypothetical protein